MARKLFDVGLAERNRVEAFSDGVLAIVITLLVLEVKVPAHVHGGDAALWQALVDRLPVIGAWVVSFAFVLVFWVAHHYLFAGIERINRGVLWLNGLFLLCIAFIPFPTAFAGEYPGTTPGVFLLSAAMFLTAASFSLLRWYAFFVARLGDPAVPHADRVHGMCRSLLGPGLYALAMALSFLWTPAAIAIQVLVPILFFLPGRTQPVPAES